MLRLMKEVGFWHAICLVVSWWCYRKWRKRKPYEVGYRGVIGHTCGFVYAPYVPDKYKEDSDPIGRPYKHVSPFESQLRQAGWDRETRFAVWRHADGRLFWRLNSCWTNFDGDLDTVTQYEEDL